MTQYTARRELPSTYGLALWLRDLSYEDEQIASVLSIEPASVPSFLEVARLKARTLAARAEGRAHWKPGIGFLTGISSAGVEHAAEISRRSDTTLHLVATGQRRRGGDDPAGRHGLLAASRRALRLGATVVPHVLHTTPRRAVAAVTAAWGPVTFVVCGDDRRADSLRRQVRNGGGAVLSIDGSGQVMALVPKRYWMFSRNAGEARHEMYR